MAEEKGPARWQVSGRSGRHSCALPQDGGSWVLRPLRPGDSQGRKGLGLAGPTMPSNRQGTEARGTCLGRRGRAAELEPRPP